MVRVGIIGSGSWGTALAWLLANNGHDVELWSWKEETTRLFREQHENSDKLPGVILPASMTFTSDLQETCRDKDILVIAVPSPAVRATAKKMKNYIRFGQLIISAAKGIEEDTLDYMTDIIEEEIPQANVAVLSGPSHAEEVGKGLPTAIVAGARDRKAAEMAQMVFMSPVFRVYTSSDLPGIQLGAALKNVIALAAGVADGMGYGDNTKAALITRGSAEIARLGKSMGVHMQTLYGLSGIGDLIVTCSSVHSRNRRAGFLMGQGKSMDEAMKEVHQVVEGVYSAKAGLKLAREYQVEMPIIEAVNKVLFEDFPATEAVRDLMLRDGKDEIAQWE